MSTRTTGIEWCERTWSPVVGCSPVSAGCQHCWAARTLRRLGGNPALPAYSPVCGPSGVKRLTDDGPHGPRMAGDVRWLPERLGQPLSWQPPKDGSRARIFVVPQGDLFHEVVTDERIAAVFGVMAATPRHRYLVLTKRPERMLAWFRWVAALPTDPWTECHFHALTRDGNDEAIHLKSEEEPGRPWPLPNVWLGVTAEDQRAADERIPLLLQAPAALRWVSVEPLLGPVDLQPTLQASWGVANEAGAPVLPGIDWVVVGGESGPGARTCDVGWIRSVVRQARWSSVAVFVKQLGAKMKANELDWDGPQTAGRWDDGPVLAHRKGGNPAEWPEDLRIREWPR